MGRSQHYLWQMALTLHQGGLITHVTQKVIQQASDELRRLFSHEDMEGEWTVYEVLNVLSLFIAEEPNHCVWYDGERIYDDEDYAHLMQEYADATVGEWIPENLSSARSYEEGGKECDIIDFDFRGIHFHWEFNASGSDWVDPAFLDLVEQFSRTYLEGEFFEVPTHDQTACFYYLPHRTVASLIIIMEQIEQHFANFDAFVEALD